MVDETARRRLVTIDGATRWCSSPSSGSRAEDAAGVHEFDAQGVSLHRAPLSKPESPQNTMPTDEPPPEGPLLQSRQLQLRPAGPMQKLFARLLGWLFGYDYFISYAHADAKAYGPALADLLAQQDIACFIDRSELPPGETLTPSLELALRRSRALVLLASPAAARSPFVQLEVETFRRFGRPIVPVRLDGSPDSSWQGLNDVVFIAESPAALSSGMPTAEAVESIRGRYRFTRKNVRRRRIVGSIALVLLLLVTVAAWQGWQAAAEALRSRDALAIGFARSNPDPSVAVLTLLGLDPGREPANGSLVALRLLQDGYPVRVHHGHGSEVTQIRFDPTGSTFVSVSPGLLRVWNADGRGTPWSRSVGLFPSVAFHPDGSTLAVADAGSGVEIVSGGESKARLPIDAAVESPDAVAFSPDGSLILVTGHWSGSNGVVSGWVRLWRYRTGEVVYSSRDFLGRMACAEFSPSGSHALISSEFGKTLLLRTAEPGAVPVQFPKGTCARFDPTGQEFAIGEGNGVVTIRSVDAPERKRTVGPPYVRRDAVLDLAYSPDGKWLAVAAFDGSASVWSTAGGGQVISYANHASQVEDVEFDPTGAWIISRSITETRVFHRADRKLQRLLRGPRITSAVFAPNRIDLVTGSEDGGIRFWPVDSQAAALVLPADGQAVNHLQTSPDGSQVAASMQSGAVVLWRPGEHSSAPHRAAAPAPVWRTAFDLSGRRVAIPSFDGTVEVRQADDGRRLRALRCPKRADDARFLDAEHLATACDDGVRVWALQTGDLKLHMPLPDVKRLAVEPGSGRVAATTWAGRLMVFDWRTAEVLFRLDSKQPVWDVIFNAHADEWAAAIGQEIHVWNGNAHRVLKGHRGAIWQIAYSDDGRLLASASDDGTVRIWPRDRTREAMVLRGHRGAVRTVDFSPGGHRVLTGSADGDIRIWPISGAGEPIVLNVGMRVQAARFVQRGRRVIAGNDQGAILQWTIDWTELWQRIRASNRSCMLPEDRLQLYGETVESAQRSYDSCEAAFGRSASTRVAR